MTSPDVFAAGASELIKRSQTLGLTWRMATGTITNAPLVQGSAARSAPQVQSFVLMDGDTVAITATNMTGFSLPIGTRVYVMVTPPSGNFIVGTIGLTSVSTGGPGTTGLFASNNTSNLAVTNTYTVALSGTMTFQAGRAYNCEWGGACNVSASTNVFDVDMFINGVRLLGGAYGPSGSAFSIDTSGHRVLCNYGAADHVNYSVQLKVETDVGTGTWFGGGVANAEYFFWITDIGQSVFFPNAFSVT